MVVTCCEFKDGSFRTQYICSCDTHIICFIHNHIPQRENDDVILHHNLGCIPHIIFQNADISQWVGRACGVIEVICVFYC